MTDTTDIEKKSLEAHVELCAQRYNALDERIRTINEKIVSLSMMTTEVHQMVHQIAEKRSDQLIAWGVAVIGTLFSAVVYLIINNGIG
jgi:predicted RNase H-like nuclease